MTSFETETKEIRDLYEAAYYLMVGAKIDDVHTHKIPTKKWAKKFYLQQWVIKMSEIPTTAIEAWKNHTATGSLREFAAARLRLKKHVFKMLGY